MFTKEELAKYINAYQEVIDGKKVLIGPHFVVRGNQKNYIQFINFNTTKKLDSIYFEDTIAKAILFKSAEKIYGVKPNSIGDMRYVTVPYAISLLSILVQNQLDLYKIWRNQCISESLNELLYTMMVEIESFIKSSAPGGLYGEWGKKEECWVQIKNNDFKFNFNQIKPDLIDKKNLSKRQLISDEVSNGQQIKEELDIIKSVPHIIWKKIDEVGTDSKILSSQQSNIVFAIANKLKSELKISEIERKTALKILDIMIEKVPELFFDTDEIIEKETNSKSKDPEITIELVKKMVEWERRKKRLKDYQFLFMNDIVKGNKTLTDQNKKYCLLNYKALKKFGFS